MIVAPVVNSGASSGSVGSAGAVGVRQNDRRVSVHKSDDKQVPKGSAPRQCCSPCAFVHAHVWVCALLWCGRRVIISLLVLIEKKVYPISWLNETTTGD